MPIRLYNTLSRKLEEFTPLTPGQVKMYVCGPTVYAPPHLGNARSVVVYDVLYRLLRHEFRDVTYVRNITDVDDKINAAAIERKISIQALTQEVTAKFHYDMDFLNVLRPTEEPRATEYIAPMIKLIGELIANGHAYEAQGHVLFRVQKDANYGMLSRRPTDEMIAGARVEVAPYKEYPGDFVLWKPASDKDDASSKFESPWGVGRPGWHIECSAMATALLGDDFDIHGGGADLMFPHHENEIAQSTSAHPGSHYAKYWVHNGFLTVDGEKMAKSVGNFITVQDLWMKGMLGDSIRYALLTARYSEPLDWTRKLVDDAQKIMNRLYMRIRGFDRNIRGEINPEVVEALHDNLNTPVALTLMLEKIEDPAALIATGELLGLMQQSDEDWWHKTASMGRIGVDTAFENAWIEKRKAEREEAKKAKDFAKADAIREELKAKGIVLEDGPGGTTWRKI